MEKGDSLRKKPPVPRSLYNRRPGGCHFMNPLTPALSARQLRPGHAVIDRIINFFINSAVLYYISCCLLLYGVHSRFPAPSPTAHVPWDLASFLARYYHTYGVFLLYVVILAGLCLLVLRRLVLLLVRWQSWARLQDRCTSYGIKSRLSPQAWRSQRSFVGLRVPEY